MKQYKPLLCGSLIITVLVCMFFYFCHKEDSLEDKQSPIKTINDATSIVNEYYGTEGNYIALDYKISDDSESFINYVIVFSEKDEIDQANLLISTTVGTGVLNFSGDMFTFEYSSEDGIIFLSDEMIGISFIDYYEKAIYDFQVKCMQLSDSDIHFQVQSCVR